MSLEKGRMKQKRERAPVLEECRKALSSSIFEMDRNDRRTDKRECCRRDDTYGSACIARVLV
jgi:hypothetical protein